MLDDDQARRLYEDWHEIFRLGYTGDNIEEELGVDYPEGDRFVLSPDAHRSLQAEATAEIWLEIAGILDGELERDLSHLTNNFEAILEESRRPDKDTYVFEELQQSRLLLDAIYLDQDMGFERELGAPVSNNQMPVGEYKNKVLDYTSNVRKSLEPEISSESCEEPVAGSRNFVPAFLHPIFQ